MSEIEHIDPFADANPNTANDSEELEQEFEAEEHGETRPIVTINYQHKPGVKTHYCCQIDRDIHTEGTVISIINAQKTNDSSGSSYITYTVRVGVCNHSYLFHTVIIILTFLRTTFTIYLSSKKFYY